MTDPRLPDLTGRITATATRYTDALLASDQIALNIINTQYQAIATDLASELSKLESLIDARIASGKPVLVSWLHRQSQYRTLLLQAEQKFGTFSDSYIDNVLKPAQARAIRLARGNAEALIEASLPGSQTILGSFHSLPTRSVEQLTGVFHTPGPMQELLSGMTRESMRGLTTAIRDGLVKGQTTKQMVDAAMKTVDQSRQRAELIIQTETSRAYREANRATYNANSGIVKKWIWFAYLGPGTCAACLAMHGTEHELSEPMGSHPRCRCTMIPKTKTWAEMGFPGVPETGVTAEQIGDPEAWLAAQPERAQKQAFGSVRLWRGWQNAEYALRDVVRTTFHPDWGTNRTIGGYDRAVAQGLQRSQDFIRSTNAAAKAVPKPKKQPKWLVDTNEALDEFKKTGEEWLITEAGFHIDEQARKLYGKATRKIETKLAALQREERALSKEMFRLIDEAQAIPDTNAINFDARRALKNKAAALQPRMNEITDEMYALQQQLLANPYHKSVRKVLEQVRPGFGKGKLKLRFTADSEADAIETLHEAVKNLPKEWVDQMNATGRTIRTKGVVRAHFNADESHVGMGNVHVLTDDAAFALRSDRIGTSTHEMTHFAEWVNPTIVNLEGQFYARRTAGEVLSQIGMGYRDNEVTKRDRFLHPYVGKDYGGKFYEVATMGVEGIFNPTGPMNVRNDADMLRFILGLLAGA